MGLKELCLLSVIALFSLIINNDNVLCRKVDVTILNINGTPADLPYYCMFCWCSEVESSFITACTHFGLFRPPRNIDNRTTELYLTENELHMIKKYYFAGLTGLKILDLSNNCISKIDLDSFEDLESLEELYLHGQRSHGTFVLDVVFYPGVFNGLISLKHLTLHHNIDLREAQGGKLPADALLDLVNLETLTIDGVDCIKFNDSFKALKNLTTIYMSGVTGACEIRMLTSRTFAGLPNLKNITMEKCRIKYINKGTFWNTPNLEYLDLSSNWDIELDKFASVAEELQFTKLQTLKINSIHNSYRAGIELLREHMHNIQRLSITELQMNENGIEFIDYGVFEKFPKTLKRLYMRKNKIRFGIILSEAVFNNDNLEVFDAADQVTVERYGGASSDPFKDGLRMKRDTSTDSKVNSSVTNSTKEMILPPRIKRDQMPRVNLSLKVLICSGSFSDLSVRIVLNFSDTENVLEYLDLSRNFMPKLASDSFDGLEDLKVLNLSTNYIERLGIDKSVKGEIFDIFKGLNSLQVLDLSNNLFGDILHQDDNGIVFFSLTELKHLNLSYNRIYVLGRNVFQHLHSLHSLNLADNYIETIDTSFENLERLSVLNLANNRLQTVPERVRSELFNLLATHELRVDLKLNKLSCNCENIPFLEWLFKPEIDFIGRDSYYCAFNNNSVRSLNGSGTEFLEWLKEDCRSYQDIIIACSTVGGFATAIFVSVFVYLNRWKLRYLYYMAKVHLDKPEKENDADPFKYDVFLSYADGDRKFVIDDMLENLEKDLQLRLNIRDRDFEIGEMIAVNISKAIKQSKKTFLLVSRHFLANKWCNFEMNIARMEEMYKKRKVLGVLFLETIPPHALPLELVDLLREKPVLDLPKDVNVRFAFWQKCKELVKNE